MQKIFFLFVIVTTTFCCKSNKRHHSIIDFFPSKKDELYEYGFKKYTDDRSIYLQKKDADTILRFFYPYEGYYVKEILFRLNKFDTAQLYTWFRKLDKNFSPTSDSLTIVGSDGVSRAYRFSIRSYGPEPKVPRESVLTYEYGKRREDDTTQQMIIEESRDSGTKN
jgi:hypothetical protein